MMPHLYLLIFPILFVSTLDTFHPWFWSGVNRYAAVSDGYVELKTATPLVAFVLMTIAVGYSVAELAGCGSERYLAVGAIIMFWDTCGTFFVKGCS